MSDPVADSIEKPEEHLGKSEHIISGEAHADVSSQNGDTRPGVYPYDDEVDHVQDDLVHLYQKTKRSVTIAAKTYKPLDWAAFFIPAVGWLRTYTPLTFLVSFYDLRLWLFSYLVGLLS